MLCLTGLLTGSCLRELSPGDGCLPEEGNLCVLIRWDRLAPGDAVPLQGMRVHLFPAGGGPSEQYDREPSGGTLLVPGGQSYYLYCYDYWGHDHLNFRRTDHREQFEVYQVPVAGAYNTEVETGPAEPVVMEPSPPSFYIASNAGSFAVSPLGTDTVRCYPENVLREFTFLIWGVEGAENGKTLRGAISGMSASYFPAEGKLSAAASTVGFRRMLLLPEGRLYRWDETLVPQQVSVDDAGTIPVYPAWFESGWADPTADVWPDDWIIGAFSTFGPVDAARVACCLTVEVYSQGNRHYSASWGCRQGAPEDSVCEQIVASLGAHGTREEQLVWRRKNGGFDIVLDNGGRLLIPPDEEPGLNVDVSDWGDRTVPLN